MNSSHNKTIKPGTTVITSNSQIVRARHATLTALTLLAFLPGCVSTIPEQSWPESRHIQTTPQAPEANAESANIPGVVETVPLLPAPGAEQSQSLYSVVAMDIPVRELLFALARDAEINIDIHPALTGQVSLNAIDQSIPRILERVSQQVDLRWSFDTEGNLLVEPDSPFWEIYRIDYVNVSRNSTMSADVSTSIASVGGAESAGSTNNSSVTLNQTTNNNFWQSMVQGVTAILGEAGAEETTEPETATAALGSVVPNRESGLINVRATSKQHIEVRKFLSYVQARALNQVLIEATVVEVVLNDRHQSGVDWTAIRAGLDRHKSQCPAN